MQAWNPMCSGAKFGTSFGRSHLIHFFSSCIIYNMHIHIYIYIYGHVPFKRGSLEIQYQRVQHSMIDLGPSKGPPGPS